VSDDHHEGVATDHSLVAAADAARRHRLTVSTAIAPLISDAHGTGFAMPESAQQQQPSGSDGGDFSMPTDCPMRDDWQRRGIFVANISAAVDGLALGRIFGAFGPVRFIFDPWYNSLCTPMQRRYAFVL
jgi:hypothetical protein